MSLRVGATIAGVFLLAGFGSGVGLTLAVTADDAHPVESVTRPTLQPKPYTLPLEYAQTVIRYCDETGVPVWLACRLFAYESGWRVAATNRNDNGTVDRGIAQINSANLASFAASYNDGRPVDPRDAETSIRVGIRYLAALYETFGSWRTAVIRYAGRRSDAGTRWIMGE